MTTPGEVSLQSGLLSARWASGEKTLLLLANLTDAAQARPAHCMGRAGLGRGAARSAAALVGLCGDQFKRVIPGRERSERTRNPGAKHSKVAPGFRARAFGASRNDRK